MLARKDFLSEAPWSAIFDKHGHVRPLDAIERMVLVEALKVYDGNASDVARALRIGRTTLYRRLAHHGLDPDQFRLSAQSI